MVTWFVSMSHGEIGDVAEAHDNPTNGLDTSWYDGRATFYGDIHGGDTQHGACGYGDKPVYGLATAALSTALFNNGYTCGACYEIICVRNPQGCLLGVIKITATNFCPPDSAWCNLPNRHFDLTQPMFLKIVQYKVGIVPIKYRRVPCARAGGIKFETKGNPYFLMILAYNVGGAGDIKAMQVQASKTRWITMRRNWGQNWSINAALTGQILSLKVTTSDGITKVFTNVILLNWRFGQTFDGKTNF